MAEAVRELRDPPVYLKEDTLDRVPANVRFDTVVIAVPPESAFEFAGVIDEKDIVGDVMFIGQLGEEFFGDRDRIGWKQSNMEKSVGRWMDRGVQPILFLVEAVYLLVDRTSVRRFATGGFDISVLYPVMNGCSTPFGTQLFKKYNRVRQ